MTTAKYPFLGSLEQRIYELSDKFLVDQIEAEKDPATFYPDLDRLAAFRLLVHAEIEEFLETTASVGLNALESSFQNGNQDMRANMTVFVLASALSKIDEKFPKFDSDKWEDYFKATIRSARKFISENNGIKEGSFRHLAMFSGKMPDEIDATLSLSLSNYGKSRGEVAHKSASRVQTLRAPSAEASAADDILAGLNAFFAPLAASTPISSPASAATPAPVAVPVLAAAPASPP